MSDLLIPIFWIPREIQLLYSNFWLISGPLGQVLCKLVYILPLVSLVVSIQSLVLIAVPGWYLAAETSIFNKLSSQYLLCYKFFYLLLFKTKETLLTLLCQCRQKIASLRFPTDQYSNSTAVASQTLHTATLGELYNESANVNSNCLPALINFPQCTYR